MGIGGCELVLASVKSDAEPFEPEGVPADGDIISPDKFVDDVRALAVCERMG